MLHISNQSVSSCGEQAAYFVTAAEELCRAASVPRTTAAHRQLLLLVLHIFTSFRLGDEGSPTVALDCRNKDSSGCSRKQREQNRAAEPKGFSAILSIFKFAQVYFIRSQDGKAPTPPHLNSNMSFVSSSYLMLLSFFVLHSPALDVTNTTSSFPF